MLTKKDKQEISRIFDEKFSEKMENVLEPRFYELRSDIAQFKDDILVEIKAMREDLSIVVGYRNLIEDHEERIASLEKSQANSKKVIH